MGVTTMITYNEEGNKMESMSWYPAVESTDATPYQITRFDPDTGFLYEEIYQ